MILRTCRLDRDQAAPQLFRITSSLDNNDYVWYMEVFHKRSMPSATANKLWAAMVRRLDIERIVPQHGAIFPNKAISTQFIDCVESMPGAAEFMGDVFQVPAAGA